MTKQELDSRLAHVPLYTESLIIREGAKMQPIKIFHAERSSLDIYLQIGPSAERLAL